MQYQDLDQEDYVEESQDRLEPQGDKDDSSGSVACCACCCCFFCIWLIWMCVQLAFSYKYSSCGEVGTFPNAANYVIPQNHSLRTPRYSKEWFARTSNVFGTNLDNMTELGIWREVRVFKTQYAYMIPGFDSPYIIAWQPWWNFLGAKRFIFQHCEKLSPEYFIREDSFWTWSWNRHDKWVIEDRSAGDAVVARSEHVMFDSWNNGGWFPFVVREWGAQVYDTVGRKIGIMAQDVNVHYSGWFTNQYKSSWIVSNINPVALPSNVMSFLCALYDLDAPDDDSGTY